MQVEREYDYPRLHYEWRQRHERFARRVLNRKPRLLCQDCGGAGGEVQPISDDGSGPFETCGFCEGTGYVDAWRRGVWLRMKRQEASDGNV